LLLATSAAQQGCIVAVNSVVAPETPSSASPPVFATPVYFTICPPHADPCPARRFDTEWRDAIWKAIVSDGHTHAIEGKPPREEPYVYMQVQVQPHPTPPVLEVASMVLSYLTLSLVPGYGTERFPVEVTVQISDTRTPP